MFVVLVLSRLVGLVREAIVAREFGISPDLDAVLLGLSFPLTIAVAVGGGLSRAAVPVAATLDPPRLAGLLRGGSRRILKWMALPCLLLAVTAILWTRLFLHSGGGWLLPATAALASLSLAGGALGGYTVGISNARGRHVSATFNLVFYNLVVCAVVFLLGHRLGAFSLALGVFLAEWLQSAFQWPFLLRLLPRRLRESRFLRADWDLLAALFWPSALIGFFGSLNTVIDRAFAGSLPNGAISALSYADKFVNLVVGLLGLAVGTPLFTRLTRFANEGRTDAFRSVLLLGLRTLLFVGLPAGVLMAAMGEPAIALLLKRGAFTAEAVRLSARALAGYGLAVPFLCVLPLLSSAALAVRRPWLVLVVLILTSALNAWLDYLLAPIWGVFGITSATVVVGAVKVVALLLVLAPGLLLSGALWLSVLRSAVFSAILGGGLWVLRWATEGLWLNGPLMQGLILFGAAATVLTVTAVLWRPIIAREWSSLDQLRHDVARDARANPT